MIKNDINNIGLNFDNSYSKLPNILMAETKPTPVEKPKLIILNKELANNLNLNFDNIEDSQIASLFSGNTLPKGSNSIAQAYAGHQFGHFTELGDGRAILIGEHITDNKRFDIQLKGAGITLYSRNGDGRATLVSMLREYLFSESMYALNIPTTRSLSVVSTGEEVLRESTFMGGILARIASSHVRVGTFQYLSMHDDIKAMDELVCYCLDRHYPNCKIEINPAVTLLKSVLNNQISLIINWMRVGFIHGVMNTDNMTVSGETIDYGPCAFMDNYNPDTVFSSIDLQGRYSYINQKIICHWNISRFAEALIPLISKNRVDAIKIGKSIIDSFNNIYDKKWLLMMGSKLGFIEENSSDKLFILKLLSWMQKNRADFTNTFISLMKGDFSLNPSYKMQSFTDIYDEWIKRISLKKTETLSYDLMKSNNPIYIARNHNVEESLKDIHNNDNYEKYYKLLDVLKKPYKDKEAYNNYLMPGNSNFQKSFKTFCGT